MKTIYKYRIDPAFSPARVRVLPLPQTAEVLHVGEQNGAIELWALVDSNHDVSEGRTFYCAKTGEDLTTFWGKNWNHVGTVLLEEGRFVVHVFELL